MSYVCTLMLVVSHFCSHSSLKMLAQHSLDLQAEANTQSTKLKSTFSCPLLIFLRIQQLAWYEGQRLCTMKTPTRTTSSLSKRYFSLTNSHPKGKSWNAKKTQWHITEFRLPQTPTPCIKNSGFWNTGFKIMLMDNLHGFFHRMKANILKKLLLRV